MKTPEDIHLSVPATRPRVRPRVQSRTNLHQRRKKFWTYSLLILSAMLMANALVGEKGYLANMQARHDFEAASEALNQIKDQNERLSIEIERTKKDPAALEELARKKLGLIKPGETLIILRDRPAGRD